jgi:glycosyltransferase involved in cell wall biosynthesis
MRKATSTITIILPTYNRAKFLPEALAAIAGQQWTDWELIVVDDGSTDGTRELVQELTRGWSQPVRYIYQENQGAYGARNSGLDHAKGKYIAFYDSDDLWLPHHLQDCVDALDANSDVDWVYGACRIVDLTTGKEISPSTFYVEGHARPFLGLAARFRGAVRIIDDSQAACCQILHGLYCGLQNSVIRTHVFQSYRFDTALRNEGEDQVVVIWALSNGFKFAFIDNVHVVYNVHESNSSSASLSLPVEKKRRVHEALIAGFERLKTIAPLSTAERLALAKRLGEEHFWHLGYATHWMHGNKKAALASFRRGIAAWPWDWRFYKTYSISAIRTIASRT